MSAPHSHEGSAFMDSVHHAVDKVKEAASHALDQIQKLNDTLDSKVAAIPRRRASHSFTCDAPKPMDPRKKMSVDDCNLHSKHEAMMMDPATEEAWETTKEAALTAVDHMYPAENIDKLAVPKRRSHESNVIEPEFEQHINRNSSKNNLLSAKLDEEGIHPSPSCERWEGEGGTCTPPPTPEMMRDKIIG